MKLIVLILIAISTCLALTYQQVNMPHLENPNVTPSSPYPPLPPACNFEYPQKTYKKGSLKYIDGIPVMIVQGTPTEMGEQISQLALIPAKRLHTYPKEMLEHFIEGPIIQNIVWRKAVRTGEQLIANSPKEYQEEFRALSAVMEYDLLVAANTMFDAKNAHEIKLGCSSIAISKNKSENGSVIMGRNFDFPSLGYLHDYTIMTIYKSPGKKTFASVNFPGIIGCFTGINEDGFCISTLEVHALNEKTTRFKKEGYPYAFCYRKLLEECSTVAQAQTKLATLPIDTATSLAVCDKNTAAVFEVTPDGMEARSFKNDVCTCTNHFCQSRFKPIHQENIGRTLDRLNALNQNVKPKMNISDVKSALDAANAGESTLQCVIFEPDKLRINIGVGACPATKLRLRAIELKGLLDDK